jgi:hypothetical protein
MLHIDGQDTPAARRHALVALDDLSLAEWLGNRVLLLRAAAVETKDRLASFVGAPQAEVCGSPFGWAAVAMAANDGVAHAHLEFRVQPQWPDDLRADAQVADPMHNVWQAGILHIGKYESFLQDEPLCTYNPNHMAKWTPHELTHRVCRFFWREGASAWEHYLGSRLNELVPIVLWYGLDEVVRGDDAGFDRDCSTARPWSEPGDLEWLFCDDATLRARAGRCVPHLRWALNHFETEWSAITREAGQGVRVPTPTPELDASSDALAYVVGHRRRLESSTFRRMAQNLLTAGEHYDDTIAESMARVERCLDDLLFQTPVFDESRALCRLAARALWDGVQLKAQEGWDAFRPLMPTLPALKATFDELWAGEAGETPMQSAALASLAGGSVDLGELGLIHVQALGSTSFEVLKDGLSSLCPRLLQRLSGGDGAALDRVLVELRDRSQTDGRRNLHYRMEKCVEGYEGELLTLEAAIAMSTTTEDEIELLCELPESLVDLDWADLDCVPNSNVRFVEQKCASHMLLQDPELQVLPSSPTGTLAVVYIRGAASVVVVSAGIRVLWGQLLEQGSMSVTSALDILDQNDRDYFDEELPESSEDWFGEMVEAGIFGVRSRVLSG